MPDKPLRPCNKPGCRSLTRSGWCEKHLPEQRDRRRSAHQRGYTHQWSKARGAFLASHPWCAECARRNKHTPATAVDHIIPHRGDTKLFWDEKNWQPLCASCHSTKTAKEDGGFGNVQRQG